jgi:hypothetical protein
MSSGGNTIEIKDINVAYINTKTDKFDNTICYFKITDLRPQNKLSPILSETCDECRLPLWKAEDGEYLIKVKQRHAPTLLVPDTSLTVMLTFKSYCMDREGTLLQGFYVVMKVIDKPEDESEK